ncbi:MAG: ABC transporter substrate-binding protein [Sulfuricaulis sp.]|nr:ABC transporter substrate-binding protein [Sulfuricaulis sp.]
MNTRRKLLLALAATLATPRLAPAQEKMRRIVWFGAGRADLPSPGLAALVSGLRELGWEEGRNISISPHWTEGTPEDEARLARQMLASNPELIVTQGRNVGAVHRARPTGPVVFGYSGNPVDAGFVQSFARPGGNMTGISLMSLELAGKRIELLKEIVPRIRRMGVLTRPEHAGEHRERAVSEEAARKVGLTLAYAPIRGEAGFDEAFRTIAKERCDSLLVFPDAIMNANAARIARFAVERRLAAVSGWATFPDNGLLLSYGPNLRDSFKGLARYVDRVLRGARPADLPVELPRTVELVVNLKTAKTLGIKVPQSIMLRADRVIE